MFMIRLIGIALVIWGLIAQPLMAAVPVSTADDHPRTTMSSDADAMPHNMEHHSGQSSGETSEIPCHENVADETCDNCETECMDGVCGSPCASSGAAALQKSSVNLDLFSSSLVAASSGARAYGLPSRIFHAPKHA